MLPLTIEGERQVMSPMTADERTIATLATTGVAVGRNPYDLRRDAFDAAGCLRLSKLQRLSPGTKVRIGGIMADGVRSPPTAKGAGFAQVEQPEGMVHVTFPAALLADKATRTALEHGFIVIDGILKRTGKVVSVTATAAYPLAGFRSPLPHRATKAQPTSPVRTQTA
jgi:hypothetical protein